MDTLHSTNKTRAISLLAAIALIGAGLLAGGFGAAYAQDGPSPWLTAFPEWEYVEAVDWAVGLEVHLEIDDPNTPGVSDYQADTTTMIPDWEPNPERGWAIFPLAGYDLKVGDRVVMTGGEFRIEHVVRNLAVTDVKMEADKVAGTADPGTQVQVWVHGETPLDVWAGNDGAWLAKLAYDIVFGRAGRAWITAEGGNATAVDWSAPPPPPPPPTPWLIAFPENEAVEGWEWPEGKTVYLTIDNAPGLEWSGKAEVTTWGDPRTYVRFDFTNQYDLKVGDVVKLSDKKTTIEHVVRNLAITGVDVDANTVAGTADPDVPLQVWVHGQPPLDVVVGEDGTWLADFTGVYDIVPGTAGRAWIITEGGNATAVEWSAPPPPPSP